MEQKGFIPIPIIVITFILIIIGGGVVLYKTNQVSPLNNTVDSFFASTGGIIYKLVWQDKFEKQLLESELELSNIQKERVRKEAEEEALARQKAEEKAQQEAIKRSQAEAKAKQEEFERKLKEQQLSEKEAEEKKMNADSDGDGLTYREELKWGTSDWDTDSDGDGIRDGEDAHPAGGGRYLAQNFEWEHEGSVWTWNYSIQEDWYEYYKNKPRSPHGTEYITPDDPFIKEIAKLLKKTANKENYHLSSFIVSFVQGLPYVEDYYTTFDEYPKYPIETFVERNGDCEDTSYLFASLIQATGLGSILVQFHNHMGVGIKTVHSESGYYYPIGSDWYYYYETTGKGWQVGDLPDDYLREEAKLFRVWDGSIHYAAPHYQERPCEPSTTIPGYYTRDEINLYHDRSCRNRATCISAYKVCLIADPGSDCSVMADKYLHVDKEGLYWDSSCTQKVVPGCDKSTTYPGYFFDGNDWYQDYKCTQKARICRPSSYSYDKYYDGYDFYWDSNCTQRVVPGCDKSTYYPGYFFDGWDYYSDYRCTIPANPY